MFSGPLTTPKKQQPRFSTPSRIPVRSKSVREAVKCSAKINHSPLKAALYSHRASGQTHLNWKTMKLNSLESASPVPLKSLKEAGVLPLTAEEPLIPALNTPDNHAPRNQPKPPISTDCSQAPNPGKRKVYSSGFDPRFPVLKRVRKEKLSECNVTKNHGNKPEPSAKSTPTPGIGTKPAAECTVLMEEALTRMYPWYYYQLFFSHCLLIVIGTLPRACYHTPGAEEKRET